MVYHNFVIAQGRDYFRFIQSKQAHIIILSNPVIIAFVINILIKNVSNSYWTIKVSGDRLTYFPIGKSVYVVYVISLTSFQKTPDKKQ